MAGAPARTTRDRFGGPAPRQAGCPVVGDGRDHDNLSSPRLETQTRGPPRERSVIAAVTGEQLVQEVAPVGLAVCPLTLHRLHVGLDKNGDRGSGVVGQARHQPKRRRL